MKPVAVSNFQSELDKQSVIAVQETLAHRTVAIVRTWGLSVGSGVCVAYKGNYFVVTARHLVRNLGPDDIYFLAMPNVPLTTTPKGLAFSGRLRPPIDAIVMARNPLDDLALLHLASCPKEMQHMHFYRPILPEPIRPIRKSVIIHGFPGESGRMMQMGGERAGAVFPYFDFPPVAHVTARASSSLRRAEPTPYHPFFHFLLSFPSIPPESDLLKDPGGLSGGGVWTVTERGSNDLWIPTDARLVGIMIMHSERHGVLIAMRSKRVWSLFSDWESTTSAPSLGQL